MKTTFSKAPSFLHTLGLAVLAVALFAMTVAAAIQGTFKTTLVWPAYTDTNATALKVYVGNTTPGVYYTNYTLPTSRTNLQLDVLPGKTYYAVLVATAPNGGTNVYESMPSPESTWNTPADLATPAGFNQVITVYIK